MPNIDDLPKHDPIRLHKYPHMMPLDRVVWERFIDTHGKNYDWFSYDVHVGTGMNPLPGWNPNIEHMAKRLSQYRIDVVASFGNIIQIIEVKPRPPIGVIGQVIGYVKLFARDFGTKYPLEGIVVAETIDQDLRELLKTEGIRFIIV